MVKAGPRQRFTEDTIGQQIDRITGRRRGGWREGG